MKIAFSDSDGYDSQLREELTVIGNIVNNDDTMCSSVV